jgi:amino acid adenylation domain-containing protein
VKDRPDVTQHSHHHSSGEGCEQESGGNAAGMLLASAVSSPRRPAIVDGDATTSYAELADRAAGVVEGLAAAEVQPGDRVAILLRRGADAAGAFFGVLASGAVAVIVNELLRPRQIEHILSGSGASALITSREVTDRLPRPLETSARVLDVGSLPRAGTIEAVPRLGDDVAQIIFTSGSTGLPKGVTVSHSNLWAGMRSVTAYLGVTPEDRIAALLPFSFDYGLNQLLCAAGTGACLVIERSPVPARIARTLAAQHVSVVAAVPPLWLQLLDAGSFRSTPLGALRVMTNSGGKLPTEAVRALRGCQPAASLVLMYGLTEAFRSTYLPPDRVDSKPSSVGQAIPGAEILVIDEDLVPCEPGQIGQLVHRGPTVTLGYWDDPEATERVFRPNPLRPAGAPDSERVVFSGDLVYRDEDGDLFFVGRSDALIKTLGYRISPDEVVEVLYGSGQVVEAVVTSEPDEVRGARIVAYVVLRRDGSLERLEAFTAEELPRYMRPARIEAREALPRTTSGKHDPALARNEAG